MASSLRLLVKKGRPNVFSQPARLPAGTKVVKFYTNKSGSWVVRNDIAYVGDDRYLFNIDDAEIDVVGDAEYRVTLSVNGGAEEDVLRGYIDYEETAAAPAADEEDAPAAGVLLLEPGETVPANTPVDTVVFEKPGTLYTWDFTKGALPPSWLKRGSTSQTFDETGMTFSLPSGAGYYLPFPVSQQFTLDLHLISQSSLGSDILGPQITGDGAVNGRSAVAGGNSYSVIWINSSGVYTGDIRSANMTVTLPYVLRLRRDGSNAVASVALGNGLFGAETTGWADATTYTKVGFGNSGGTAAGKISKLVYESLTPQTGNALKGYWDGTQLKSL